MSIDRATAVVKLPGPRPMSSAPPAARPGPARSAAKGTDTITLSSGALAPADGYDDADSAAQRAADRSRPAVGATLDPVLGRSVPLAALVGLLTVPRGCRGRLLGVAQPGGQAGFPVMYSPPQGWAPCRRSTWTPRPWATMRAGGEPAAGGRPEPGQTLQQRRPVDGAGHHLNGNTGPRPTRSPRPSDRRSGCRTTGPPSPPTRAPRWARCCRRRRSPRSPPPSPGARSPSRS